MESITRSLTSSSGAGAAEINSSTVTSASPAPTRSGWLTPETASEVTVLVNSGEGARPGILSSGLKNVDLTSYPTPAAADSKSSPSPITW